MLNVGELVRPQPQIKEAPSSNSDTSAQKYTNITKPVDETGEAYRRESTVASMSRIGFNNDSATPSRPSTSTSEVARRTLATDEAEK